MAKSGFEIKLGGFEPYLVESIIDALTPKAVRQQVMRQAALSSLARLQPIFDKLPEEERKNLYNKFFQAYGMAQPPFWRGLFGAKAEPILPLPEGTRVEYVTKPSLFGKTTKPIYIFPEVKPHTFTPEEEKPLLSKSHKKELEEYYREAGYGPEEAKEAVLDVVTKPGKSEAVQKARIKERAINWMNKYMQETGATKEEAREALNKKRPALGIMFGQIEEDEMWKKKVTESLITSREEKAAKDKEALAIREKELERRKAVDEFNQAIALRRQQFAEQVHQDRERNRSEAARAKDKTHLLSLMEKAYGRYVTRIQKEVAEAHKMQIAFKKINPDYEMEELKPNIPSFEEWLGTEGRPFLAAAQAFGMTDAELYGIVKPKEMPKGKEGAGRKEEGRPQKMSPGELLREENDFRKGFGLPPRRR